MQICITRSQWVNKVAHKVVFRADDMIFVNVYVYRIKVADKPQKLTKHMSMGLWIYFLMFVYICRWRFQLGRDKIRFVRKYIRTKFFGKYVSSNLFMNSLWPIDTTIWWHKSGSPLAQVWLVAWWAQVQTSGNHRSSILNRWKQWRADENPYCAGPPVR